MTRLYVADMGSLLAWKYFAAPDAADAALVGFEEWFHDFAHRMGPTHLACAFDAGNDRRRAIWPEYKLNRRTKPKDEAFVEQLRKAPAFVANKMGLKTLWHTGEEADDVIASVATKFASADTEIIVVSNDKDLSMLVNERVQVYDPKPDAKGECRFFDAKAVEERFGVPPWRVADYLALVGDHADGIKGIKGIGKAHALAALQQTRSMGELFRKAAKGELKDLTRKTQSLFVEGRADYELSLKLVQLRLDIPVPDSLDAFALRNGEAAA